MRIAIQEGLKGNGVDTMQIGLRNVLAESQVLITLPILGAYVGDQRTKSEDRRYNTIYLFHHVISLLLMITPRQELPPKLPDSRYI